MTNDVTENDFNSENEDSIPPIASSIISSETRRKQINRKSNRKRKRNETRHSFDDISIDSVRKKQKVQNKIDIEQELDFLRKRNAAKEHMKRISEHERKIAKNKKKNDENILNNKMKKQTSHQELMQQLMDVARSITTAALKLDQSIDKIGKIAVAYKSSQFYGHPLSNSNNSMPIDNDTIKYEDDIYKCI